MTVVMRKGTLFQKLKVLDEMGKPVRANQQVLAELILEDNSVTTIRARTDGNGLCEMMFPPFREGIVYASDRPDTVVMIDYSLILKNEWITLFLFKDVGPEFAVTGLVLDETGRPLRDILVMPTITEGTRRQDSWTKTSDDGSFSFPAFEDEVFRLSFRPVFRDGLFYSAADQTGLRAGMRSMVTMSSVPSVKVDLYGLIKEKAFSYVEYDAWLESSDGGHIEMAGISKRPLSVLFHGVPDGMMRGVIMTKKGERFQTGLFEVKEGESPAALRIAE